MISDPFFADMARRSDSAPARWRLPFIRWIDQVEAGWSVPLLLAGFVVVWTTYLSIAYLGSSLHPDVLETWTLGRSFEWGYAKHPPWMGWVARAWTSLFPLTDWSMQLMSMVNAALALLFVDLIARRYASGGKRLLVLLLLILTPAYQFHAQRFNANTVLLSLWPFATWCFLRSWETRKWGWAAAAGAATALAMLGKYYSIFLVAGFAFAAVAAPGRRAYFVSAAPWISALAGLVVLGPHVLWLVQNGTEPFGHALLHAQGSFRSSLMEVQTFLLGLLAAMGVSIVTWIMIAGRRLPLAARDLGAAPDGLKLVGIIGLGTLVFPCITSLVFGTDLPSLWALQGLFLFVVPLVCSTSYAIEKFYVVNTTVLAAAIAVLAVIVAAPIHAVYRNSHGYEEGRNLYVPASGELTQRWHRLTGVPLPAVSGDDALAFAVAFYSPDHPRYARPLALQYAWPKPRKVALEKGWAALCFIEHAQCRDWMREVQGEVSRAVEQRFTVRASLLGRPGVSRDVVALLVPPEPPRASKPLTAHMH